MSQQNFAEEYPAAGEQAAQESTELTPVKSERTIRDELEKGDILAVVLSGVVMFVLPAMGVMALACMIAYFVFAQ